MKTENVTTKARFLHEKDSEGLREELRRWQAETNTD